MSWADIRYALRTLIGGRLFSAVAIVCLTLAIATNATMFSVFDAIFLRPLPFKDAAGLVSIAGRQPETARRVGLALGDLRELRNSVHTLQNLSGYSGRTSTLTDGGEPERVSTQLVTANLFATLGVAPQRGRHFEEADDVSGAAGVALISDALWRRRYGTSETVLGQSIRLDNVPYTIAGVMPPKFRFPSMTDLWIAITPALTASAASSRSVSIVGRLEPQTTLARANAELAGIILPARGSTPVRTGVARAFGSTSVGSEERVITGALMSATTVLLILACVNLANLLMARGAGRRREIAVRAALGASRGRIIGQLLTESILLSLVSGALALPLAWYGITWVHDAVPPTDPLGPYYIDWALDARTIAYSVTIAVVTGLAFGLAPAFDAAGKRLQNPLREGGGAGSGRVQRRVHSALIVVQMALAVLLLAGAALFVRTYAGLRGVELGYDTSQLMTMRFYLSGPRYADCAICPQTVDAIAKRLESLPGAHAAMISDLVPLDDQGGSDEPAEVEGRAFPQGQEPTVHFAGVAGRWPETFDVRVTPGRTFFPQELETGTAVALVNEKLARAFWPGENPIGRRFRLPETASHPWLTVIGVVPDIRTVKLDESEATPPTAYLPHAFAPTHNYGIVVRTRTNPESVVASVRDAVHAVDPSIALFDVYPMEQVRWLSYWMYVMWGTLFGAFGVIALVIAGVGVYGVVFYTVALRTREIGVRVALGARRGQVVGPMMRHVAVLAIAGLAIGLAAAYLVTPVIGSLLIGVPPHDPVGFATVALLLLAVALIATWWPAWRASAVDPTVALRDQ